MQKYTVTLTGFTPISFNRCLDYQEKIDGEKAEDTDVRLWRERAHFTKDGSIYIPKNMLKNALVEAVKYSSDKIAGKGNNTYTKHFEAGCLVDEDMVISAPKATRDTVEQIVVHVPTDGVSGGGKRVFKRFPIIDSGWIATTTISVFDDQVITPKVFKKYLAKCGQFIGLGRYRPRNNGEYGRFMVKISEPATVTEDDLGDE